MFCKTHLDDNPGDTAERLDTGIITRSKRKDLGISVDELTTDR